MVFRLHKLFFRSEAKPYISRRRYLDRWKDCLKIPVPWAAVRIRLFLARAKRQADFAPQSAHVTFFPLAAVISVPVDPFGFHLLTLRANVYRRNPRQNLSNIFSCTKLSSCGSSQNSKNAQVLKDFMTVWRPLWRQQVVLAGTRMTASSNTRSERQEHCHCAAFRVDSGERPDRPQWHNYRPGRTG
jgi:hypothetical protein